MRRDAMSSLLRSSAAHVVVTSAEEPVLEPDDAHHLANVLRLRDGELVTVTDGAGRWRACRFRQPRPSPHAHQSPRRQHGERLEVDGPVVASPQPSPLLTIGFTPVKGDRAEWTVQKLTELGVDRIVPLRTERSVVRWEGERGAAAVERMRRVAREAVMQSRRVWLPTVTDVDVIGSFPGAALAEPGGEPLSLAHPVVLVGPEGGWAPSELADGRPTVSLGGQVLRAETAALAAAAILGNLRFT